MKPKSEGADPRTSAHPKKEDLELAREILALARLIQGQLVATHPWVAVTPRNLAAGAMAYPAMRPGAFPDAWTVPAVWPCFP